MEEKAISPIVFILILVLALVVGYYLYTISYHARNFQPNVKYVISQLQDEYKAIEAEINSNKKIDPLVLVKYNARLDEIRTNLNRFSGCKDSSYLDISKMTCVNI